MDNIKIRIRLGDREIEAEGPREVVEQQIEKWKGVLGTPLPPEPTPAEEPPLDIFHSEAGGVTLRRRVAQGPLVDQLARGLLLLLYGYKSLHNTPDVLSPRLARDLRLSGYTDLTRLSRAFERLSAEGLAVQVGKGKGTRYRLTEPGFEAAKKLLRTT